MKSNDISIVTVLYKPEANDIHHIENLAKRFKGVIVDNSDRPFTTGSTIGRMRYVCNHANLGIAEAQNIGIRMLLDEDTDYIVFFDQDSRVSPDYPIQIAGIFNKIKASYPNLALLGPTVVRKDNGKEYKSAIHRDRPASNLFTPRRDVISSGCCIAADAIKAVGLNDAPLFIDYVDYEWCWRAASKGFQCGITPALRINHKVGQKELHIGRQIVIISKPFRYFYQYRNYLWLLRRKYVPLQWKIATGIKFSLRLIYFPLFVKGGYDCWKHMIKGIKRGITKG